MTVEELGATVERVAKEMKIEFTKIMCRGGAGPPMNIGTKRPVRHEPVTPAVYAEIDGGMSLGKFTMTLDEAEALGTHSDGDGQPSALEIGITRKLEDAAWEANPTR